ncbi:dethiobiotin synthase [Ramlibacter sp. 2FC]|uniref:dethiobiotin synthase n=1 Tax=Ramlibacter sp. 2FC TaxID=2502188 RepID=UPI0010F7382C|nr:dethiobiotin synthase [Ramlibacter sp. 2FC]
MNHWPPARACFVTGTDTEVGKTRVSAALLHWMARQGWRSAGLKPVAAGTELIEGIHVNEDVRRLRLASSLPLSDAEVGPYQFEAACAPHIAAHLEGRSIERDVILQAARALAARADALVVEGVGGFCVPLGPDWDTADLAQQLGLPVMLVVGLRLGCINHALLTAEAVRARGLRLVGWIGNAIDPAMPWMTENIAYLRTRLAQQHGAPCLGLVPWLPSTDAAAVAAHLDDAALRAVFTA